MLIKFNTADPRRNLPARLYRKRGESNFIGSFERVYVKSNVRGVGGRQFALSGFGIADFIWVNRSNLELTAFEMKLADWKKALYQAYRYTYFADYSIVVLPLESICIASKKIDLFQELNVGLWGFDGGQKRITKLLTPTGSNPRDQLAKERALDLIRRKVDFSVLAEKF